MTELRDARLRAALDHAPDAALRPPDGTRDAIHAAAHAAVRPSWRRWWAASGQRTGWSAAFATLLLAGIVTLLWRQEDVPPAAVETPVSAPEPPPVQQPSAAAPSAPAAAPAPAPAASPAPAPAPQPSLESRAAMQDAQQRAPREQALQKSARPAVPPRGDWTQVRIEADGASKVVPREQAGRLPGLLAAALAAPSQPSDPATVVGLSTFTLELAHRDQPLGVLEWRGDSWRWVPLRDARQARTLAIDLAHSDELFQEARRLLER